MLVNHRRTLIHALALIGACAFMLIAVGRHDPSAAPDTTLPAIGVLDGHIHDLGDTIRFGALTGFFKFMNVIGGGLVTIPLRVLACIALLARKRWRAFSAFALTWLVSEVSLTLLKQFFHRGRPPVTLVAVSGYSFPSGHAVAGAATAVALVLAFTHPGPARLKWEWAAVAFAFVMALSRVYLWAHWFSDTVTGVLLGAGIALAAAAVATEVRDLAMRHRPVASTMR